MIAIIHKAEGEITYPFLLLTLLLKGISITSSTNHNFFQQSTMGGGLDNKRDRGGALQGTKEHSVTNRVANTLNIVRNRSAGAQTLVDC